MFNKNNANDLEFKLLNDQRFIVEEHQNQMRVLQNGMWGPKGEPIDPDKCKFEVRTVYIGKDGVEVMGKGCSFSEEGINELTRLLVENNKGNTKDLLEAMSDRPDFLTSIKQVLKNNPDSDIDLSNIDDEYFDAKTIFMNPDDVTISDEED